VTSLAVSNVAKSHESFTSAETICGHTRRILTGGVAGTSPSLTRALPGPRRKTAQTLAQGRSFAHADGDVEPRLDSCVGQYLRTVYTGFERVFVPNDLALVAGESSGHMAGIAHHFATFPGVGFPE
jgi:hypothetical protein